MLFLCEKYAQKLRKVKYERITLIKNITNNLPLTRQFALTATIIPRGGAGSEVWNRLYMIAPVKKFGRVRLIIRQKSKADFYSREYIIF